MYTIPIKPLLNTYRNRSKSELGAYTIKRSELELELVDVVTKAGGFNNRTYPSNECTTANLCNSAKVEEDLDDATFRSRSRDYYLGMSCREVKTGMSMVITVKTRQQLVVAFPDSHAYMSVNRSSRALLGAAFRHYMKGWSTQEEAVRKHYRKGKPRNPAAEAKWYEARKKHLRDEFNRMQRGLSFLMEYRMRLFGFHPDLEAPKGTKRLRKFPFLLVFCEDARMRDLFATVLYENQTQPVKEIAGWRQAEVDTNLSLQFMESTGIRPGGRFTVDLSTLTFPDQHRFTADMEASMSYDPYDYRPRYTVNRDTREIEVTPSTRESPFTPFTEAQDETFQPRRVLCVFDLECTRGRKSGFPQHSIPEDAIICASMVFCDSATKEVKGYVLSLPGVSTKTNQMEAEHKLEYELIQCADERHLLETFRDLLIVYHDVDDVSGWNIDGFDNPYILGRMKLLNLLNGSSRAPHLSKIISRRCDFRFIVTTSSAHGTRESCRPDSPFVTFFDMMVLIKKREKFEEYNLKTVSQKLLGNTKIDMPPEDIFRKWNGGDPEERREVCAYCYKDGELPLSVWDKLLLHSQTAALARICCVTYADVLNRGELWKAYSLAVIFAHEQGYMLNEDPGYDKAPTWKIKKELEEAHTEYLAAIKAKKSATEKQLAQVRKKLKKSKKGVGISQKERQDLLAERDELEESLTRKRLQEKRAKQGETKQEAAEVERRYRMHRQRRLNLEEWKKTHGEDEDAEEEEDEDFADGLKRYKGATVMDAKCGLYSMVATCDFEALYPNVIKECNICHSTMATKEQYEALKGDWSFRVIKLGDDEEAYVAQDIEGVLPRIVTRLLTERKKAKRKKAAAKKAGNKELAKTYDAAQLALKIVCNSQYGAIGAPQSSAKYACVIGARAVTGRGRELLEATKAWILEYFPKLDVIYGDTDSVMVSYDGYFLELKPDPEARERAIFEHAEQMCKDLTAHFGAPINLEFEKVFEGYLLLSKKRYFGYKKAALGERAEMDSKGVSSVRRSSVPLLRRMYAEVQELLFEVAKSEDHGVLFSYLQRELQRIADDKCTVDELTRTCQLKAKYDQPQAQSEVCRKIAANPERYGKPPARVGDRVPFCMRRLKVDSKAYEMAEDPDLMKRENIPIATHYFVDTLRTNIEQILEVANCFDMERVRLMFDQLEDITVSRAKGQDPTMLDARGATILDHEDPSRVGPSKQRAKEIAKQKLAAKEAKREKRKLEETKQADAMARHFGLATSAPSPSKKKKKKRKKSKKERERAQFFKELNKKRKQDKQARQKRKRQREEQANLLMMFSQKSKELSKRRKTE